MEFDLFVINLISTLVASMEREQILEIFLKRKYICTNVNIHFCLIWISNGTGFNQEIEDSKLKVRVDGNVISDKHFERFVKYEFDPEKAQGPRGVNLIKNGAGNVSPKISNGCVNERKKFLKIFIFNVDVENYKLGVF